MLNTLCGAVFHYRDEAAEMDEALLSSSGLSSLQQQKRSGKEPKYLKKFYGKKRFLFLT